MSKIYISKLKKIEKFKIINFINQYSRAAIYIYSNTKL